MTDQARLLPDDDARLPLDIRGLDRLVQPVWVFDPFAERKLYANPSAIALWGAEDLTALRARDFSAKSDAARTRTALTFEAVKAGEHRTEVWTFYPRGVPVSVRAVCSHIALRDGSSAILFEAVPVEALDADHLRALEVVRHLQAPVSLYGLNGQLLFDNPAATRTYGDLQDYDARCAEPDAARAAWAAAEVAPFRGRLLIRSGQGSVVHDVTLQRTVDPISGSDAMLCFEADDSDKLATEAHLADQLVALSRATDKAEAANLAKSVFLANMSHEIRTPLNGVVSLADLLCSSDLTATQREAAELIRTSGRSLEHLLADILQLAQIEAGEVSLSEAPFDLATLAKDVTDLLRLKAEANGSTLSLAVTLPSGAGRRGDGSRVRQILTNLVSNAVKFTARGSVSVSVEESGSGVRLRVLDTGIGFDPEQKARIFERFQQADGSITRRFGGSGLGLAITAELVTRMGGRMDCESAVGRGSTFWADLPLEAVDLAGSQTAKCYDDEGLEGLKVLVADDHPVNRRVLEMILEPLGAAVVAVENGMKAVEAVAHEAFDVVLMDMQMPVMDGLEATRTIVAADGPPIVMVSANGLPDHVAAALDAGAVAFVTKPIEPAVLIETVIATIHPEPKGEADQAVNALPAEGSRLAEEH